MSEKTDINQLKINKKKRSFVFYKKRKNLQLLYYSKKLRIFCKKPKLSTCEIKAKKYIFTVFKRARIKLHIYRIKRRVWKLPHYMRKYKILNEWNRLKVESTRSRIKFSYIINREKLKKIYENLRKSEKKILNIFFISKLNSFFVKKIFKILIERGNKIKVYRVYFNWLNIIKFKLKIKTNKNIFLLQLMSNLVPKINFNMVTKRGKAYKVPNLKIKKLRNHIKLFTISSLWLKKSFINRKEKTFILKFFSELFEIRLNKGSTIKLKKSYYFELYNNKRYFKYIKWT